MLQNKTKYRVAVAGAAGLVGRELIEILEERNFPVAEMILLDNEEAAGERLEFQGRAGTVKKLAQDPFEGLDIVFFATDAGTSSAFAPVAVRSGAAVIDLSGAFRGDPNVPLIVPEVNRHALSRESAIVASPGPAAIAASLVLKPIHEAVSVKRVVMSLLRSVSGSGKQGMDELAQQTVALLNFRDVEMKEYAHQIAFNCLPQVDAFLENGSTREEDNIGREVRKILEDDSIRTAVTAVQVPVFRSDSVSLNLETRKPATANEIRAVLSSASGVVVYDDPDKNVYPTSIDAAGKDELYVGRIRDDDSVANGVSLWIVSDNVRKGAALNAVQIAEILIT